MGTSAFILSFLFVGMLLTMVLYLLFSQLTVKKLRKNPETKHKLGVEFMSGWDVINVAQALSLPTRFIKMANKSQLSFLYSNVDILNKHTSRFDRVLAYLFYWCLTITGLLTLIWSIMVSLSVFAS